MTYYGSLPPEKKEEVKSRMRAYSAKRYNNMSAAEKAKALERYRNYSKQRYQTRKAQGLIKLKNRPKGQTGRDKQSYVDSVKVRQGACVDCGLPCEPWNVVMFAFDHLNPAKKLFALSKAKLHTFEEIDLEIAKCELVCHNCHAFRTWIERHHDNSAHCDINTLSCQPTFFDLLDN